MVMNINMYIYICIYIHICTYVYSYILTQMSMILGAGVEHLGDRLVDDESDA